MRQNAKRRARNLPVKSQMKTMFKKGLSLIKEGKADEAAALMPEIFSIIDMAVKKNLLHENNAARKKSKLAKALNDLQKSGGGKSEDSAADEKKKPAKNAAKPKSEEKK